MDSTDSHHEELWCMKETMLILFIPAPSDQIHIFEVKRLPNDDQCLIICFLSCQR